jgi:hypothetical protein
VQGASFDFLPFDAATIRARAPRTGVEARQQVVRRKDKASAAIRIASALRTETSAEPINSAKSLTGRLTPQFSNHRVSGRSKTRRLSGSLKSAGCSDFGGTTVDARRANRVGCGILSNRSQHQLPQQERPFQ